MSYNINKKKLKINNYLDKVCMNSNKSIIVVILKKKLKINSCFLIKNKNLRKLTSDSSICGSYFTAPLVFNLNFFKIIQGFEKDIYGIIGNQFFYSNQKFFLLKKNKFIIQNKKKSIYIILRLFIKNLYSSSSLMQTRLTLLGLVLRKM